MIKMADVQRGMAALKKIMEHPDGPQALQELFGYAAHGDVGSYLGVTTTIADLCLESEGERLAFIDLTVQPES